MFAASLALLLGGCAQFTPDGGVSVAQGIASAELGKETIKIADETLAASVQSRVSKLLKSSLSADAAVQIALFNNRGLQASYNELGITEAQLIQSTLPPRPRFSIADSIGSGQLYIERQIAVGILSLATLQARKEIAADKFKNAQLKAAEATLRLAADTRKQYYRVVAAGKQLSYLLQAKNSAETVSELIKKLGESGGMGKLDQGREHVFYAETVAQIARAMLVQRVEKERLTRLMGLWGKDANFRLASNLPPLPNKLQTAKDIEALAISKRIDLQQMRGDLDILAKEFGLTQTTRFVTDVELSGASSFERGKTATATGLEKDISNRRGVGVSIVIPIYDFGQSKLKESEETYMRSANLLAEKAVTVRSEVREAYTAYRGNYDIARHYEAQILPLRKIIQDESLLQYSGMLIDVTTLIADARARMLSNAASVDARRDFWLASVDLKHALIGGGASNAIPDMKMAISSGAPE